MIIIYQVRRYGSLAVWHWKRFCHNLFNQRLKNLLPFKFAREIIDDRRWFETACKVFIQEEKQYMQLIVFAYMLLPGVDDSWGSRDVARKKPLQERKVRLDHAIPALEGKIIIFCQQREILRKAIRLLSLPRLYSF